MTFKVSFPPSWETQAYLLVCLALNKLFILEKFWMYRIFFKISTNFPCALFRPAASVSVLHNTLHLAKLRNELSTFLPAGVQALLGSRQFPTGWIWSRTAHSTLRHSLKDQAHVNCNTANGRIHAVGMSVFL